MKKRVGRGKRGEKKSGECAECRSKPVVYVQIGGEAVGLCMKHWRMLVYSDAEW
jgi:hypothetical protein